MHGIPEVCVTDNSPAFISEEFTNFIHWNGIHHITTAHYHPASNGQAERGIQIIKAGLKKMDSIDAQISLGRYLLSCRTTSHTTGLTPVELLMGRQLRTVFDLMKPDVGKRARKSQNGMEGKYEEG